MSLSVPLSFAPIRKRRSSEIPAPKPLPTTEELETLYKLPPVSEETKVLPFDNGIAKVARYALFTYGVSIAKDVLKVKPAEAAQRVQHLAEKLGEASTAATIAQAPVVDYIRNTSGKAGVKITLERPKLSRDQEDSIINGQLEKNAWPRAVAGEDAALTLLALDAVVQHEAPAQDRPGTYAGSLALQMLQRIDPNDTRVALK